VDSLNKKVAYSGVAALVFSSRFILPGFNLLPTLAPFGEESHWRDSRLMNRWKGAFAGFLLPKYCDSKAETEPKRNIPGVLENDFSSKILHVGYWQTLRGFTLQGQCQIGLIAKICFGVRYVD
jgi:hypothetical protein